MLPSVTGGRRTYTHSVLESGTDDATALAFGAFTVALLERDYRAALAALERALTLNPNSATVLGHCAIVNAFAGRYDAAIEYADKAIRYSPLDPWRYTPYNARGLAYLYTDRYDDAISAFHSATEAAPRFGVSQMFLAAAYSLCGRNDKACAAIRRFLELEPNANVQNISETTLGPPEKMEALLAALRKAGLPASLSWRRSDLDSLLRADTVVKDFPCRPAFIHHFRPTRRWGHPW
jgi:adenylate cyclase